MKLFTALCLSTLAAGGMSLPASAELVHVRVVAQNLAPANSVTFAPLRVGFNGGTFDSFDVGMAASEAIVSIAEGGSGSAWFPAFARADRTATLGTTVGTPAGPLLPGATVTSDFVVDTEVNPYFTFGSMVVPSNDHFIGNDSPTEYQLFNPDGTLAIQSISLHGSDVWDAGSEVTDPAGAAFLVVGDNSLKTPENGVVNFNFTELDAYNGLMTAAGYVFDRQFEADDLIYRISFEVIPADDCLGDLNGDGSVDGADLGLLLSAWGGCP